MAEVVGPILKGGAGRLDHVRIGSMVESVKQELIKVGLYDPKQRGEEIYR
jgi:hypothetical protein